MLKSIIKARDFVLGFMGWSLFSNITFLALWILLSRSPELAFISILAGIWLPTVIVTPFLFAKKRIWGGTGILAIITMNTVMMSISEENAVSFFWIEASIWLLTVITIHILFAKGRIGAGAGIVIATIIITLMLPAVMGMRSESPWFWLFPYPGRFIPICC